LSQKFTVTLGNWDQCKAHAGPIRLAVFVQEQGVPLELELDAEDAYSVHAVAYGPQGDPVGTGRLLRDGHIGRMAVSAACRGQGVGSALLTALINEARSRHYPQVVLSAQLHAQAFYAAHGFVAEGDVYLDAGIQHVTMRRGL
jgi:predicted GNAT family N-acyltransferase